MLGFLLKSRVKNAQLAAERRTFSKSTRVFTHDQGIVFTSLRLTVPTQDPHLSI